MTQFKWKINTSPPSLARSGIPVLHHNPVIEQIMLNRDISSPVDAKAYLNPLQAESSEFDPVDVQPINKLIEDAQRHQKRILIYGDFDVDGITSTAIMTHFLGQTNPNVGYYIPNRFFD